jgi:GWxTD domain-containing protein
MKTVILSAAVLLLVNAASVNAAGANAAVVNAQNPVQGGGQIPAQNTAQAAALQPALFNDSLANIRDTAVVRGMERTGLQLSDDASPEAHLRFALIEKRVFELTLDDDARQRAQHSFDKAKDREKNNTWAHFGYGWALTHGKEFTASIARFIPGAATLSSLGGIFGLDAASRAKRSLQNALEIDPAFEPAVIELARLALLTKQPKDVAAAASAARSAVGAGRATAGIYTQLAELEMLRGNAAAAAEAARAGIKLNASGFAQHALGVSLLLVPGQADEGADAYMAGLSGTAFGDTALYTLYMKDAATLLTDADRAALSNLSRNEQAQWLHSFWERSAAKAGRTLAQRLTEHFTRTQYAYAHYVRGGKFAARAGEAFAIDTDNKALGLDDRGLIYIRLGKPDVVISTPPGEMTPPPNESWVYGTTGKPEMYNFHKFPGGSEWVLSPLEACDPGFIKLGQTQADRDKDLSRFFDQPYSVPKGQIGGESRYLNYLEERAKYDPSLSGYMMRCRMALEDINSLLEMDNPVNTAPGGKKDGAANRLFGPPPHTWPYASGSIGELRMDAKVIATADRMRVNAALKADEARPKFAAPLQAITQVYAFRGDEGTTSLTAAVLIPGERFTPAQRNGVLVYPMSLSLIVIDSVTGRISRADTKPTFRADQTVAKGKWFRATVDLKGATPTQQGDYRVIVENTANTSQGDVRAGSQKVPSFAGSNLMLSDLVVGESGDGRWKRGKTEVSLIPTHQIEHGKQFKLFYEIYNLPPSTKYRTSIMAVPKASGGITGAIKSVFGKSKSVELTFDDTAGESNGIYGQQEIRSIAADMDAGEYDLIVTITNTATQASATQKTKLIVLSPKDLKAK